MPRLSAIVWAILFWVLPAISLAAPYIPKSPDEVLEQLPVLNNQAELEMKTLQRQLNANPDNLSLAVGIATRLLETARTEADPRYYGYAEAAVKTWWRQNQPPVDVLMVRATIRQHRHDFTGALQDLQDVLANEPRNAQAWLTQAVIQAVRGDYDASLRSCSILKRLGANLPATTCLANAASLSGSGQQAYQLLQESFANTAQTDGQIRLWTLSVLAEIAARLGDNRNAEAHFLQAMALQRRDVYLLSAYSDFLLEQHRPAEVVALLKDDTRPDGLLLRLALAEQATGSNLLPQHIGELQRRIDAYRLRGENIHQREEARFNLALAKQPEIALRLALENWQVQHEPWDARLVLEAALASGKPEAARPVLAWLSQTKLQDRQLPPYLAKLGAQ
ncbi:MAG: hypothetical protein PHH59_00350 [Methylovulum sp.]|uniref:tetratricopeptide repeat protein n=1 Tax=Methylovulum sp. TaxID=1916980 RepID=UPI0026056ABD|nr:hypothetical protein [Methylovulum sp.]MDD2722458.1 hypothetical protein [Methylovulum sp.]MDD5124492.1 hypothetical protein [Methylovulum sp.]